MGEIASGLRSGLAYELPRKCENGTPRSFTAQSSDVTHLDTVWLNNNTALNNFYHRKLSIHDDIPK